jgi:hypothetical protein
MSLSGPFDYRDIGKPSRIRAKPKLDLALATPATDPIPAAKGSGLRLRLIAISVLFIVVLVNFGGHWLSPNNPIVAPREKPAPQKSLRQIAEEARPKGLPVMSVEDMQDAQRQLAVGGWGGASNDRDANAPEDDPDAVAEQDEPLDESEWAGQPRS